MKRSRFPAMFSLFFAACFLLTAFGVQKGAFATCNTLVAHLFLQAQNPVFTFLSLFFHHFGGFVGYAALFLIGLLCVKRRRPLFFLYASLIATALLTALLKQVFAVERPVFFAVQQGGFSFPSGHTASSFLYFFLLAHLLKKAGHLYAKWLCILPPMIALSRLYLSVHWASDIVGGAFVGLFGYGVSLMALAWLEKRGVLLENSKNCMIK